MDLATLQKAVTELTPHAESQLRKRYGTFESFVDGFGYHNCSHGLDVSWAGGRITSELVKARRVQPDTVPLAQYAGLRHDDQQGDNHEQLSAQIAAASMRAQGIPEQPITRVVNMIEATKVLRINNGQIVQAANRDNPEEAALADADVSSLGRKGVYRALLLCIEQQHRSGIITLPSPTNGMYAEPDRDETIKFLRFQFKLYDCHRFMLDISHRLFPHQEANRDEIWRLLERYEADRISFSEMLMKAKQDAMS